MNRGDIVTVAGGGDYTGKPRPAVVVQSDLFNPTHESVSIVPVTTTLVDAPLFRVDLRATKATGLRTKSQAMVDKLTSVRRDRLRPAIGRVSVDDLARIDEALRLWLSV